MIPNLSQIRNRLLSGWERHPWDHHYQVKRKDVVPGLKILAWASTPISNALPVISRDSEMNDALINPERYQWFAEGKVTVSKVETRRLVFTSLPFCKVDHWYATAKDEDTGKEADYSLFALGIVPDYIFVPKRDGVYPAGWNRYAKSYFNR